MPDADRLVRASAFDGVADEYERGRPGYPREAIDWVLGSEPLEVLDLGAGTGKLTAAVLDAGHRVSAVEPLVRMRAILQDRLPAARVLEGTAEQLPLADASVDAVVVGAAFHWFDQSAALAEVARVLRPPGVLGLLGNSFDTSVPWVASLREILGPPAIQRPGHWPAVAVLAELFEEVSDEQFAHNQHVERSTLRDLASSRSSLAIMGTQERELVLERIDALWRESEELSGRRSTVLPWLARVRRCRRLRPRLGTQEGLRARGISAWETLAVDAADVRPLRASVLRPGQPSEQLVFAGDDAPDTLHAAVRLAGAVVAVASIMPEPFPGTRTPGVWRIRGMATTTALRGLGIGAALFARCETHARAHAGTLVWCNARVGARHFYERAGMTVVGERFEIPPIGEHYLMRKALQEPAIAGTC